MLCGFPDSTENCSMVDIWEVAVSAAKQKRGGESDAVHSEDATLLFVGNRNAGKTTAIYRFLSRDEVPKPTLALEYTFGRQSRSNLLSKDVCHIWELGGGTLFTDLLDTPIRRKTLTNVVICIMVDLSRPQELLVNLTTLLRDIRKRTDGILADNRAKELRSILTDAAWNRVGQDHQDRESIDPCPVPLVILGGKYDLFQNFEPEQRKVVCRTLRYVAHVNGATLQFFSSRMESLVTRTRALLSHLVFGSPLSNYISQDYNKPLIIPAGADAIQHIGSLQGDQRLGSSLAAWTKAYENMFPQVSKTTRIPEDPGKDPNFREPMIDNLRAQKDDEFERHLRNLSMTGGARFDDDHDSGHSKVRHRLET